MRSLPDNNHPEGVYGNNRVLEEKKKNLSVKCHNWGKWPNEVDQMKEKIRS